MSNISKFNDYYWDRGEFHHISIHDLYTYPLLIGTKELIEADVASSLKDANGSVLFGTIYAHDMHDGQKILITGMDGSFGQYYNNQELYVKDEGGTFGIGLKFFADSALTNEILFYDLEDANITSATAAGPCVFTLIGNEMTTGTEVLMSGFDGSIGNDFNGETYYIQVVNADTFNVSSDVGGTNLLSYTNNQPVNALSYKLVSDDTILLTLDSSTISVNNDNIILSAPTETRTLIETASTVNEITVSKLSHNGKIKIVQQGSSVTEYEMLTGPGVENNWSSVVSVTTLNSGENLVAFGGDNVILTTDGTDIRIHERSGLGWAVAKTITPSDNPPISNNQWNTTSITLSADGNVMFLNDWTYESYRGAVRILKHAFDSWSYTVTEALIRGDQSTLIGYNEHSPNTDLNITSSSDGSVFAVARMKPRSNNFTFNEMDTILIYEFGTSWTLIYTFLLDDPDPNIPSLFNNSNIISLSGDGMFLAISQTDYEYKSGWQVLGKIFPNNNTYTHLDGAASIGYDASYSIQLNYDGDRLLMGRDSGTWIGTYRVEAVTGGFTYDYDTARLLTGMPNGERTSFATNFGYGQFDSVVSDYYGLTGQEIFDVFWTEEQQIHRNVHERYATVYGEKQTNANEYKLYSDAAFTIPLTWQSSLLTKTTGSYLYTTYADLGGFALSLPILIVTNSTTGTVTEVYTPPNQYTIPVLNYVNATTGHLTISTSETNRYRLLSLNLSIPANADYGYLNTSGVRVPGAEVNYTMARDAGGTPSVIGLQPDITIATDSIGHVTGATIVTTGTFATDGELVFPIQEPPSQYVPPAPNTAAMEDYFDINNAWTNLSGYQGAGKMFAKDVIPTSASITYVQPSTTNMSQNGRKYVRSSGFVKTKLEVNYTNLTKAEFQELHADAQAARGQAATFYLVVALWGGKVLNFNTNASRSNPRHVTPYVAGETLLKLGGFNSNEQDVFKKGEMIIATGNQNGGVSTVLNTVDANVYGEAEIRIAYGNPYNVINGTKIYKNPYWIVVSLDSDEFQYTVDTFGLYNVTVGFETGSYS
jgi:hypothetical protein